MDSHRSVSIERVGDGEHEAVNRRGGRLRIGHGDDGDFTPTELLLAAVGACTGIDVDTLTSRRAQPEAFTVRVDAQKIRDESGNRLDDIVVTFHVALPDTDAGRAAREQLPGFVQRSHDRLCTVSRTIELGTAVSVRIEESPFTAR
jgi:putative redox protein